MPRSGTLVICVQNLDFSGANQVVLNIVAGRIHSSNVIVLSPKNGTFAARFVESGASVRIGELDELLHGVRDVFCIICNTLMTANIVVEMSSRPFPVIWILHEWWDDEMIKENLRIRNYQGLTLKTVKQAMSLATRVVCVCESQRNLYNPTAPTQVIFVGVPDPIQKQHANMIDFTPDEVRIELSRDKKNSDIFTFLCLGIICPRKNQLWTIELFKKFAKDRKDVRLQIVGARYTRVYEIEYLEKVRAAIDGDPRIELHDVTEHVDTFYKAADCLLLTSINEVTPMVISEALSWSIPVLSTDIAGIKEMFVDGVEGFLFSPDDEATALRAMKELVENPEFCREMGKNARKRYESMFDIDAMVSSYRQLVFSVAPPVILIDMDGTLVDWDSGFVKEWGNRCRIDRSKSYEMEECILSVEFAEEVRLLYQQKGFFERLEWIPGAKEALLEMDRSGLKIYLCTSPVQGSVHCVQEKMNWVQEHLGEAWLERLILCFDKSIITGDLLIDDKPMDSISPGGRHTAATWKQIVFDAPYNRQVHTPRLNSWKDWRAVILPMLDKYCPLKWEELSQFAVNPDANKAPSHVSFNSKLSFEQLQKHYDQLNPIDKPLSVEDAATVISGSISLVDGCPDEEKIDLILERGGMTAAGVGVGGDRNGLLPSPHFFELVEKKRELQQKIEQVNESYQKLKFDGERKIALEIDSAEVEGLQVFRPSYQAWRQSKATK